MAWSASQRRSMVSARGLVEPMGVTEEGCVSPSAVQGADAGAIEGKQAPDCLGYGCG